MTLIAGEPFYRFNLSPSTGRLVSALLQRGMHTFTAFALAVFALGGWLL